MRIELLRIVVVMVFMASLAFLSLAHARNRAIRWSPPPFQKTMHIILYGILAVMWAWVLQSTEFGPTTVILVAWAIATGFGIIMELLQLPRKDRTASWGDVARDAAGAAIGLAIGEAAKFSFA